MLIIKCQKIYGIESGLHAHVVPTDLIAPGTMRHVGEKLCQFAATNCTTGKQSTHIMSFKEAKPLACAQTKRTLLEPITIHLDVYAKLE